MCGTRMFFLQFSFSFSRKRGPEFKMIFSKTPCSRGIGVMSKVFMMGSFVFEAKRNKKSARERWDFFYFKVAAKVASSCLYPRCLKCYNTMYYWFSVALFVS